MSLINDALKRAKQARLQNPFDGQPMVPLQPVDYAARPNWFFRTVMGLLVLASLALSGWFFCKWWLTGDESQRVTGVASQSTTPAAATTTAPAKPARPKQAIKVSTNIVRRANFVAPAQPQTETPGTPTTNAPVPAPGPFADLKLQSIIFRDEKPAALINGEMLLVGEEIRGARVVRIERQSVTIERKGETNALRLPRL